MKAHGVHVNSTLNRRVGWFQEPIGRCDGSLIETSQNSFLLFIPGGTALWFHNVTGSFWIDASDAVSVLFFLFIKPQLDKLHTLVSVYCQYL